MASRLPYQDEARPIAEAKAAPLMATAAWTVRSLRSCSGQASIATDVGTQPTSGPPMWSLLIT
jgi:hypothetical protein